MSWFGKAPAQQPAPSVDAFALPWKPGQGGAGRLTPYQFMKYPTPGVSIGFQKEALDAKGCLNFFGDGEDVKPIYALPDEPGKGVQEAASILAKEELAASDLSQRLIQGYLDYTAEALNLIYGTDTGHRLIEGILATKQTVLIVVQAGMLGNAYSGGGLCVIADEIINQLPAGRLNGETVLSLAQRASRESSKEEACNWLATKANKLPLYSLFVQNPQYADTGFLDRFLRYKGVKITGQDILNWLKGGDGGAFATFLATDKSQQDGVALANYFKSALIMLLYGASPPGKDLSGATVMFKVVYAPQDEHDAVRERPPAIGLAHELIHAYNSAVAAQPGVEIYHYSVLMTERLCVGLAPFDDVMIDENKIRSEWAKVKDRASVAFDRTSPAGPRLVYDLVPVEDLAAVRGRASTP